MAAFAELDHTRFDVRSIVDMGGLAVIERGHRDACLNWLRQNSYAVDSIDFGDGIGPAMVTVGELLKWRENFGYDLGPDDRNLDALEDGFYWWPDTHSQVLELLNGDVAFHEDARFLFGLLSSICGQSRRRLALGFRFFAMLALDRDSPLIDAAFESLKIPSPYWSPGRSNPFENT
jgi:hypothetical protein